MNLPAKRQPSRLPKRFPVGATYLIEGRGGEDGQLRVLSRYVVLPGGRRIDIAADFAGPASPRASSRQRSRNPAQSRAKSSSAGGKKIFAGAGTTRQHRG